MARREGGGVFIYYTEDQVCRSGSGSGSLSAWIIMLVDLDSDPDPNRYQNPATYDNSEIVAHMWSDTVCLN